MLTVVPALAFQLARQYEGANDYELSELLSSGVDMVYQYQGQRPRFRYHNFDDEPHRS